MPMSRKYFITISSILFLFIIFVIIWFAYYNRFAVLYYHEQIQLFRFDKLYFYSYMSRPGGLLEYVGSFLTQFYLYPVIGSMIIGVVLASIFILFYSICKSVGSFERLFCLSFIPIILLFVSFVHIAFDISYALGLILFLIGFRWYIKLRLPIKYIIGIGLCTVLYFIAGGNAFLLVAMIVIFECFEKRYRFKYGYISLLAAWSILLPYLAWKFLYIVPIHEAYFALTPGTLLLPTITKIAWLSFPVLYFFWRLIAAKVNGWMINTYKVLILNCILIFAITAYGSYSIYNRRIEMIYHMAYGVQHGNWKNVAILGKTYPAPNPLVCYFTNIALAESGQMPYRMFQYHQIGTDGLFINWQWNYHVEWFFSEVYYRLGLIPEAEQCAFKAMVSSPKEPNAQALERLVFTNMIRRDSTAVCKYLTHFEHSGTYRQWAKQQRKNLALSMADSTFHIPNAPQPYWCKDFFVDYRYPDYTLQMLLQTNPQHRIAFEYLMAFYMLEKNIEQVKWCIDTYYKNFDYPNIPTHYEEALLIYQNVAKIGQDFFLQYPISNATLERFNKFGQAYNAAQGSKRNFEQLKKQFGNTYWYYMQFIESSTIQGKDEKKIY